MPSDILAELQWRGLVYQSTDPHQLAPWLKSAVRTVYAGFDPTADSLHVGSLLPLMMLRRFQRAGHRPIALVGGATGMIGDPSGKSQERNLLSVEQLALNVQGVRWQMNQLLDFGGESGAIMVDNHQWMKDISYLTFLRDVGKNAPISVMMSKDSVKSRLERGDAGLSYTEFSYMLLQAYDFVHLHDRYGCELQVGGSDQWGNITAGMDLGRRMRGATLYGLTCPLLTRADGAKMGKTESGAIWLSAARTSPYVFYQYWLNVADEDAGKCLRFLTELSEDEVVALDEARAQRPHQRESQQRLAESLTELIHGVDGLQSARRASEVLFGQQAISGFDDRTLLEIFADVPSQETPRQRLADRISVVDALVTAGLAKSKGEARRTVEQGGAYVNNHRVDSVDRQLTLDDLASESILVLRHGRKKYALLRFV